MCYHVSNERDAGELEKAFKLPVANSEKFKPHFDFVGWEKPYLPVISKENPREIDMYRWRLVPAWVKDEKDFKANTLNARNDELFTKNSYRSSWMNRCLVLCTGFFEPHYPVLEQDAYESWYIKPKDKPYFALGAIYQSFKGENTVSIVTTDASPELARIHNDGRRQPLILTGDAARTWLTPDLTKEEMSNLMLFQYPDEMLVTYRTLDNIFHSRIDTNVPEAILPYQRPKVDVLGLFGV
ncbi:SOS response-associated peptidase [Dyadobacter sandarakinus]|uniref:Abasic site processing protein n=1 Tax=Dyadobacter sandarakinus TaxID=2747268 RepID=A0ABX7I709_9BACT|nr:SOS response-associated peptidase family protein [Dyadobacter sandarakinus]QRR01342.1 SOS response-associated peptidase [Dyadobacter sandarakinus]